MQEQERLQRLAELEADLKEVETMMTSYKVRQRLTRGERKIYEWLYQRCKEIESQIQELR